GGQGGGDEVFGSRDGRRGLARLRGGDAAGAEAAAGAVGPRGAASPGDGRRASFGELVPRAGFRGGVRAGHRRRRRLWICARREGWGAHGDGGGAVRIVTGAEMAAIDRRAIEEVGIPAAALMETAGLEVAKA